MISKLPIEVGDEIKLVVLHNPYTKDAIKLEPSSGYCNPSDYLQPAFFPISGTYNEYGNIENVVKDDMYNFTESYLRDMYESMVYNTRGAVGTNIPKPDGTVVDDITIVDFLKGIERRDLQLQLKENKQWITSQFSFVMIRSDVWNRIFDYIKDKERFYTPLKDGWGTVGVIEYLDIVLKEEMDHIEKFVKLGFTHLDIVGLSNPTLLDLVGHMHPPRSKYIELMQSDMDMMKSYMRELLGITTYLLTVRLGWMVTSGSGSQSAEWEDYIELADIISDISKQKISEYEDEV